MKAFVYGRTQLHLSSVYCISANKTFLMDLGRPEGLCSLMFLETYRHKLILGSISADYQLGEFRGLCLSFNRYNNTYEEKAEDC